jgi:hypothetical protein
MTQNLKDLCSLLRCEMNGEVRQENNLRFTFQKKLLPEAVQWLKEKQIKFDENVACVILEFDDPILAMEFKLRFIEI